MSPRKYTLKELESRTGFGARTIRNYIDKGLLPGAYSRGRYASYGREHLDRLLFLRKLKNRGKLPLDEVRRLLLQLSSERIKAIAHGKEDIASIAMKPSWEMHQEEHCTEDFYPSDEESFSYTFENGATIFTANIHMHLLGQHARLSLFETCEYFSRNGEFA